MHFKCTVSPSLFPIFPVFNSTLAIPDEVSNGKTSKHMSKRLKEHCDKDSNTITVLSNVQYPPPPATTSNVVQQYEQTPVEIFVGGILTNCTINTTMPK